MKKMKRLLSCMLVFIMAMSFAIPSASAVDFADIPDNYQYYDAIQSLVVRGVINGYAQEDGTSIFKPDATITRAEFSKMVICSLGLDSLAKSAAGTAVFPDVAAGENGHWAAGYVKTAFDMKIINGFDDGTFKPEENVTYEQAIKMVVCAKSEQMGAVAAADGGYPYGYVKMASKFGMLKGITDGVQPEPAKRGTIAKLIDNMIKTDISDAIEGPVIGNQVDELIEEKAQIISVYGSSLDGSSVSKNVIKVINSDDDKVLFNISELDNKALISSYLGKMVTLYYYEDASEDIQTLKDLSLVKNRNYEVTVMMEDLTGSYSDTDVYYYDEEEDEEKISVDSDAVIFYNGAIYDDSLSELLDDCSDLAGSIRFLAPGGKNDDAEVIFVTVYENLYVTSVASSSKTVYGTGASRPSYVINPDDNSKVVTIKKGDKEGKFSDIKKDQILTISTSVDGDYMEVLISGTTVSGRITGVNSDEGILTVTGKEYTFAAGVDFGEDLAVGTSVKLYLDAFGEIAKYTMQTADGVTYIYGYLLGFENFGNSMNPNVQVSLLNMNLLSTEEPQYYSVTDKISVNNRTYTTKNDFNEIKDILVEAASLYDYDSDPDDDDPEYTIEDDEVYQPIKFVLTNNKVSAILTGIDGEATAADLNVDASYLEVGAKCTTVHTGIAGVVLGSNTKVLYVPTNRSDNEDYTIKRGNSSGFAKGAFYHILLIDVNKSNSPSMVVVYDDEPAVTSDEWLSSLPGMVTARGHNEIGYRIEVTSYSGSKTDYYDESSEGADFYSRVQKGDIVRVVSETDENRNKIIKQMEIVMDVTEAYAADEFIQISARQESVADIFEDDEDTSRRVREGDNRTEDRATMSLLAGTAYDFDSETNTFLMALEYVESGADFDRVSLTNDEKMQTLTVNNSTKIVFVNFDDDGAFDSIDTEDVDMGQVMTYEETNIDANKVFVYRAGTTVRWVVVLRAPLNN